jgi:hypothetical protein
MMSNTTTAVVVSAVAVDPSVSGTVLLECS